LSKFTDKQQEFNSATVVQVIYSSQLQQANATNDESVKRRYWIKRLPPPARAVNVGLLESSLNTTLTQLATAADAVMASLK